MGSVAFHFSTKYVNALIFDEYSRMYIVHIKRTMGGFFFATLGNERYLLKMDDSKIKMWYSKKLIKSFKVVLYTTAHYLPMSPENIKDLELIITKNGLPRMDMMLYNILHELGRTEGTKFKPHRLDAIKKGYKERTDATAENVRNIVTYLNDLNVDQIITPVQKMTDFIWNDMIQTDPKFLDSVVEDAVQAEVLHREVSNNPIGAKKTYIMYILIALGITVIVGMAIMGWQAGWFNGVNLSPTISGPGAMPMSDIYKMYPTPEALKAAVDGGSVNVNSLPPEAKKMLQAYKPPTATPKEMTVEVPP